MGGNHSRISSVDDMNGVECEYRIVSDKESFVSAKVAHKRQEWDENKRMTVSYHRPSLVFSRINVRTWKVNTLSTFSMIEITNLDGETMTVDCTEQDKFDALPPQVQQVANILIAVSHNVRRDLTRRTVCVANEVRWALQNHGAAEYVDLGNQKSITW